MHVRKEAFWGLVLAPLALAQNPCLTFEVASIKPAATASEQNISVGMSRDPARIAYANVTLKSLITQAYRVKEYQVAGPDWLDSERFDMNAKIPDGCNLRQAP